MKQAVSWRQIIYRHHNRIINHHQHHYSKELVSKYWLFSAPNQTLVISGRETGLFPANTTAKTKNYLVGTLSPLGTQRNISGLKTNFSLSPSHSANKSSSHRFSEIYQISPGPVNRTSIKHTIFEELVPLVFIASVKIRSKTNEHTTSKSTK